MPRKKKTEEPTIVEEEFDLEQAIRDGDVEVKENMKKEQKSKKTFQEFLQTGIVAKKIYVEIEFLTESLGVSPMDPDLYARWIAERIKNSEKLTVEDKVKLAEEERKLLEIMKQEGNEKGLTGFMKTRVMEDKTLNMLRAVNPEYPLPPEIKESEIRDLYPIILNYQLLGYFKEKLQMLKRIASDADVLDDVTYRTLAYWIKKEYPKALNAYKKTADFGLDIWPRYIAIRLPEYYWDIDGITKRKTIDEFGRLPINQRSLRAIDKKSGEERVAIAVSEMIPPKSSIKFVVNLTRADYAPLVEACLHIGQIHGFSGRRNDGFGKFRFRLYPEEMGFLGEPTDWNVADKADSMFLD